VAAQISGKAVAITTAGFVLLWSGVKGQSLGYTLKDLLRGKVVPAAKEAPPTIGVGGPGTVAATPGTTGSAIADEALKYVGHPYSWGGYYYDPAGWDCSSCVSWVLSQVGINPPGGPYDGHSHGPVVAQYYLWSGAADVQKDAVQAGDLIIFPPDTHIGIATSATEFLSAEDPADGTAVAPISEGPGPWIARRTGLPQGTGASSPGPHQTGTGL
jgi:cell wall-associated NlpC family hydrolase